MIPYSNPYSQPVQPGRAAYNPQNTQLQPGGPPNPSLAFTRQADWSTDQSGGGYAPPDVPYGPGAPAAWHPPGWSFGGPPTGGTPGVPQPQPAAADWGRFAQAWSGAGGVQQAYRGKNPADIVSGIYSQVLGRNPSDPEVQRGIQYWAGIGQQQGIGAMLQQLMTSSGFASAGISPELVIRGLYRGTLGKEVDSPQALQYWMGQAVPSSQTPYGPGQGGNPTLQNVFGGEQATNDLLKQLIMHGLRQQNEVIAPGMLDAASRLASMPGMGELYGSGDIQTLRSSIYDQANSEILRQGEQLIGPIPGMSNIPTGAMLTAAGIPYTGGGDPNAPLRSDTGSIAEAFLNRGGTRMHPGAYSAAVGEVLAEMQRQQGLARNTATQQAMQLGLTGRGQDIQRLLGSANVYGSTPTLLQPGMNLMQQAYGQWFQPWQQEGNWEVERERIAAGLEAAGMPWEEFGMDLPNPFAPFAQPPPGAPGRGGGAPPPAGGGGEGTLNQLQQQLYGLNAGLSGAYSY